MDEAQEVIVYMLIDSIFIKKNKRNNNLKFPAPLHFQTIKLAQILNLKEISNHHKCINQCIYMVKKIIFHQIDFPDGYTKNI